MILRRHLTTLSKGLRPTIGQLLSQTHSTSPTTPITVNGWVKSVRRQKRVAFAVITDGSSPQGLQAVFADPALARRYVPMVLSVLTSRSYSCDDSLTNGAAVRLTGVLTDSIGAGQAKELQVHKADVVGPCDPEVSKDTARLND
jgi:asparaginyl-tRNA synthetase